MEGKITGNRKKIRKNPENHGCSVQYTVITVEAKNRNASTARNDFRRLKNYHVLSFRRKGGRVSKRTKRYTFPSRAKISNSSRDRRGRSSASGEWEEIAERDWAATANESKHPLPNLSPRLRFMPAYPAHPINYARLTTDECFSPPFTLSMIALLS